MSQSTSVFPSISRLSSILAATSINGIDIKNMSLSTSPPTNLSPMDITPGGCNESPESVFNHPNSTGPSPPDSTFSTAATISSLSSVEQLSVSSKPTDNKSTTKSSPRLARPQLTSRLSSRSGGKRHASIGSARELPFPAQPAMDTAPPTQSTTVDNLTPGWNARLREMGLHVPGISSPKSARSGSISSGAPTPKSPDDQRASSYFSFRRRGSGVAVSPGKTRASAATPPPPPTAPPQSKRVPEETKRQPPKDKEKDAGPSPIPEELTPGTRRTRANLSLDLTSTLASRGSTASLPLFGHTPVEALLQGDSKRRASMVAPIAPPPHVHTPPAHPPAYEYPFLPHHAPRQPLEVRVEENPPGQGGGDAGSWVISVRLPGFHPDGITVGTRRGRVLMIVADNYNDDDGAGHFERRISFGYDADMAAIRAEFNGDLLRVTVPRRWMFGPNAGMPRQMIGAAVMRPTVENPDDCK